jgi:hypothetical protein
LQNEAEDELTFSTSKFLDVKQTRQLVTEITQRGAALYDALDKEPGLRVSYWLRVPLPRLSKAHDAAFHKKTFLLFLEDTNRTL